MSQPTMQERLATLEALVEQLEKDMQENTRKTEGIHDKIDDLVSAMTRYKGFFGGIAFLGGCIVTFFKIIPVIGPLLISYSTKPH